MEKQHKLDDVAASAWSTHRGDAVMKINEIPRRVFEVMEKDEDGNPRNPEWLRGKQPFRGKHI